MTAPADAPFGSLRHRAWLRVAALFTVFAVVLVAAGVVGSWAFAPALGWVCGVAVYCVWVWAVIARLDPAATASHALREDPSRSVSEGLLFISSLASFGAIALLLVESASVGGAGKVGLAALTILTIAASWILVQTLFTLRYAALYYRGDAAGVDFNQPDKPRYTDFAYLAFTIGMTYQVSDTEISSHTIRATALRQALIAYVFGVVVLAATINLISSLAK